MALMTWIEGVGTTWIDEVCKHNGAVIKYDDKTTTYMYECGNCETCGSLASLIGFISKLNKEKAHIQLAKMKYKSRMAKHTKAMRYSINKQDDIMLCELKPVRLEEEFDPVSFFTNLD